MHSGLWGDFWLSSSWLWGDQGRGDIAPGVQKPEKGLVQRIGSEPVGLHISGVPAGKLFALHGS